MVKVPATETGVPGIAVKPISPVFSVCPQQETQVSGVLATVNLAPGVCAIATVDRAKSITAAIRIVFFIYNCSFAKRGEAIRLTGFSTLNYY